MLSQASKQANSANPRSPTLPPPTAWGLTSTYPRERSAIRLRSTLAETLAPFNPSTSGPTKATTDPKVKKVIGWLTPKLAKMIKQWTKELYSLASSGTSSAHSGLWPDSTTGLPRLGLPGPAQLQRAHSRKPYRLHPGARVQVHHPKLKQSRKLEESSLPPTQGTRAVKRNSSECACFWRRKWQHTPVLLLGISHGRRSLVGYSP